jgi:putative tryptophan/tyrosine transport system substrate-binding protein
MGIASVSRLSAKVVGVDRATE